MYPVFRWGFWGQDRLFLFRGKPVKDIRTGLKKAYKDVGILYGCKIRIGSVFTIFGTPII
ncbi:MAG: hypothetical protein DSY89_08020 [Deltaproteobacteria bacterium]|nr:MAG: hypothetical protein DSY89_08020 [Deltaproteobacteria bacterium]